MNINLSKVSSGGVAGAPLGAAYVLVSANASLSFARVLAGTANQIIIADGGAGNNITLSTPQDIATTSSPQFNQINISDSAATTTLRMKGSGGLQTILSRTTGDLLTLGGGINQNDIVIQGGYIELNAHTGLQTVFNIGGTEEGRFDVNGLRLSTGNSIRTNTSAANTFLLQAYDVDGAAYTTFATLTANNTPTCDLDDAVTKAGQYIYRVGGTDVSLADGGTNASLTADNGAIAYSTSSALALLASTPTAGKALLSGSSAAPAWSTPTYPSASGSAGKILRSDGTNNVYSTSTFADTYTASNLLYSNGANTVTGLATVNSGILVTSGTGVPSIATDMPTAVTIGGGYIYRVGGTDVAIADGGTNNSTAYTAGSVIFSNGTSLTQDNANFFWDDINNWFGLGTTTPLYRLDVTTAAGVFSQVRFGNSAADSGGYLISASGSQATLAGGASHDGTNWIARATTANIFNASGGGINIYTDTGLTVGNSFTITERLRISASAGAVFNDPGNDIDFRIEGDTATNLFVCDAGLDAVLIGTTTAGVLAEFRPTYAVFNEAGSDIDFKIEGDTAVNLFYVDASTDRTGFNTATPLRQTHIYGAGQATSALTDAGNTAGTLYIQDSGTGVDNGGAILFGFDQGYNCAIKNLAFDGTSNTRGSLAFCTRNANTDTALTERMIILWDGKVGLGVSSPTNDLSFGGNATRKFWMERHTTANTAGNSLTIQSGGATSGATDKAGGNLILQTGSGTGNSAPALIRILGDAMSSTSGTADRSLVDRFIASATKVLTDGSATNLVNATIANNSVVGGIIRYTIEIKDGVDLQVETGFAVYSSYNKAGTVSGTITEVNSQQNLSAGTLTTTWAISNANPAVISLNANSSLTPATGYPRIVYSLENLGSQAVAIQ